ncbi:MAG: hypothetical protein KY475_10030 [Planctomycetes bacterium]|nr:hypothetical protein [Planctomycetota bacterium]
MPEILQRHPEMNGRFEQFLDEYLQEVRDEAIREQIIHLHNFLKSEYRKTLEVRREIRNAARGGDPEDRRRGTVPD